MSTNYPGALDSFVNPTATDTLDSVTVPHAAQHDNINDAMSAVQVTLGVNPQGGSATVVARLTAIESSVSGKAANNQTFYIGTTSTAINRSSASQTLTGVSIDGNAATVTNGITTATTSLPNVTSVNSTTIPASATLLTSDSSLDPTKLSSGTAGISISGNAATVTNGITTATTSLPNVTSVNSTTIPASATLLTTASTSSGLTKVGLSSVGVVHSDASGNLTSSTIVDADVSASAAIADSKLATISTAGKVSGTAITSGNISTSGNIATTGTVAVSNSSTSTVGLVIKPTGTVTISGVSISHAGSNTYDTVDNLGAGGTAGFYVGQTLSFNFGVGNQFTGSTTVTKVLSSTLQVSSFIGSGSASATGGTLTAANATQQDLQEWQGQSGAIVASVNGSGTFTATKFIGVGTGLTSLDGANLLATSVATTALISTTGAGTNVVTDTTPTISNPTITSLNASGTIYRQVSGAPAAVTTTISATNLLTMWVSSSPSTAQNTSLPSTSSLNTAWLGGDTAVVEWTYINGGTAAITLTAGTSHTAPTGGQGSPTIAAGTSARFGTRRSSGGSAYITYRLA